MLQILHTLSKHPVMRFGLFAILLFAFILFGIGDMLRAHGGSGDAATIGDQVITPQQLSMGFKQQVAQLGKRFGGTVDPAAAKRAGFVERVLDAQINDMVMGMAAHDQGFAASTALVSEEIHNAPALQDPATKQFSRELFDRFLAQQGISESDAINAEKLSLSKRLLSGAELGPIRAPKTMLDIQHRFTGETRRGQLIRIDPASLSVPAPTADQLTDYYHKHEAAFTTPEYRDFSFLSLQAVDLAKSITVTPEELAQDFEARKAEFKVPERRDLSQIVVKDEAKAKEIAAAARDGKTLAIAAKSAGATEQPMDLGLMGREDLPEPLQQPIFSAPADSVLDPVQTPFGWHVIVVRRIEPQHAQTLDEAKPALTSDLKNQKAGDLLAERAKSIDDQLAGGASLADAGHELNLVPVVVKGVNAEGKHADGTVAKELAGHGEVLKAAFAADRGSPAQMTENRGGAFAVKVDQVVPPALKPFDSLKPEITEAYLAEAKAQAAIAKASALLTEAQNGATMAALAKSANVVVTQIGPYPHSAADKGEVTPIVGALYDATMVGEIKLANSTTGPVLVQLSEIIAPPAMSDDESSAARKTLESGLQTDLRSQYEYALRDRYKVHVDNDVVEQVKAGIN